MSDPSNKNQWKFGTKYGKDAVFLAPFSFLFMRKYVVRSHAQLGGG